MVHVHEILTYKDIVEQGLDEYNNCLFSKEAVKKILFHSLVETLKVLEAADKLKLEKSK